MSTEQQQQEMAAEQEEIQRRISRIKQRLLVLSGKGGVGKSTVAVNLAVSLAAEGNRVGLLDVDIHGPSVPQILGLSGSPVKTFGGDGDGDMLQPVRATENLTVMSIGFLLENRETAVIWRGPMKFKLIKQFLKDVEWGDLDYLVVDSPPGTGDEPLSVAQLLGSPSHAVAVTTPQELSISDVRKCITFCRQVGVSLLGIIENMSGFVCPHCGHQTDIFNSGGGRTMSEQMEVPFLGSVPLDPQVVEASDGGNPYMERFADSPTGKAFSTIASEVQQSLKDGTGDPNQ